MRDLSRFPCPVKSHLTKLVRPNVKHRPKSQSRKPRYREQETEVIGKSQNDIHSLVNVRGLQGHHGLRSEDFKKVLGHQEQHKTGIVSVKQEFSKKVDGIYKFTKEKVDEALNSLTGEAYTIDEELEWILTDADTGSKGGPERIWNTYIPGLLNIATLPTITKIGSTRIRTTHRRKVSGFRSSA